MTNMSHHASLRVMTFNVRGALFDDGVNCWPNRADLNVRAILRHAPDVIGFQETHAANLDVYRERLAGYTRLSEMARVEGAKLIAQRLLPEICADVPVIVTGDFNCTPGSTAYRYFMDLGFIDAYTAAGHVAQANTFHAFQGRQYTPKPQETDRIDWILLRSGRARFTVTACDIVTDAEPPLYPSDHYPILAYLVFH